MLYPPPAVRGALTRAFGVLPQLPLVHQRKISRGLCCLPLHIWATSRPLRPPLLHGVAPPAEFASRAPPRTNLTWIYVPFSLDDSLCRTVTLEGRDSLQQRISNFRGRLD